MSIIIFRHEIKTRLKSVIIWSISVSALVFVFFSFFPVFAEQAALMNQMLAKFPKELLVAFGMGSMDYSTVLGFMTFYFLFIQLCFAIQAGNYGFGLVSIEENELTADFLLTRPLSRPQILSGKLLAAVTSMLVTDLIFWVSSFTAISIFRDGRDYDLQTMILLLSSVVIFQLFFLTVGLAISLLFKRIRSVPPYSLGLAFGMYVINAFSGVFGDVKLELITPYKHYDPAYIVSHASYNTPLVLANISISLVALALSYWLYARRDIQAIS